MGKRLITQRRGHQGGPYHSPSHRHKAGKGGIKYKPYKQTKGEVIELIHDPGRSAPIAQIKVTSGDDKGQKFMMIAPESIAVNQEVSIGEGSSIEPGNVLPLYAIPEGTPIYNIELQPGDGGKLVRAAGTVATLVSHGTKTIVQLPSGQFKSFQPQCRATVGVVAGGGRKEKPYLSAGKKFHTLRSKAKQYPKVSGVAMNPVNHPHGGGSHQHVGKPSTVSRHAPPGRKVGHIAPKRRKKKK